MLEVADDAELGVSVVDDDVVAEDRRGGIRRRSCELDAAGPEGVVGNVCDRGNDGSGTGSAHGSTEAVLLERVVVGEAPAVRSHAELGGKRMVGVDAAVGRDEVVARREEHATFERKVQLGSLVVLGG